MKHLFVPYEIALALKEKGFDEPCLAEYVREKFTMLYTHSQKLSGGCLAPLYQQVIDWFREKYDIIVESRIEFTEDHQRVFTPYIEGKDGIEELHSNIDYYESLTQAINHAITLIP